MKIGYARVSKIDQKLDLQMDALTAAGCEKIFSEKFSGMKADRPELFALIDFARAGDALVVWKLDRLARSLKQLIELAADLEARGIQLISLQENIDTTTTTGKLFFQMFGALAEFERSVLVERTRAGLDAAKARGKFGGRKRALDADKLEIVKQKLAEAATKKVDPDFRKIGHIVGASERTIRRVANGEYSGKSLEA